MDTIVIIDYGRGADTLAKQVRQQCVFSEVVSPDTAPTTTTRNIKGYMLSDGPHRINNGGPQLPNYVLESGMPVMGIGYGMHALVKRLGGSVKSTAISLDPMQTLRLVTWSGYHFFSLGSSYRVQMTHADYVAQLPRGFHCVASTPGCENAAIADATRDWYGFQFQPDDSFVKTFLFSVCNCKSNWTMANFLKMRINDIRKMVKSDKVFLPLSSSVASVVAALLLHKALGPNLQCVLFSPGFMRPGEIEDIKKACPFDIAEYSFVPVLKNCYSPRDKRAMLETELETELIDTDFGTNMMAVVDDFSSCLHTVMELRALKPLSLLLPCDIRELGKELGVPERILQKTELPFAGLAEHCAGMVTPERLEAIRQADAIFQKHLAVGQRAWVTLVEIDGEETCILHCDTKLSPELLNSVAADIASKVDLVQHVAHELHPCK